MYKFVNRNITYNTIDNILRLFSLARKSHYEILNLRRNCSEKDIKEAFIRLSKEFHPDRNKDANAQQQFVRIVEAYNILGKPSSRAQYDRIGDANSSYQYRSPPNMDNMRQSPKYNYYYEAPGSNSSWHSKKDSGSEQPYYGGLGIKKIPNYVLIMLCFGIAFVGTVLQLLVIREMYVVQRRQALERSRYLSEELERVKEAAKATTNEMQTRIILEKIVGSTNPTVATASLGQALATAADQK